jgi:hypothetical protein
LVAPILTLAGGVLADRADCRRAVTMIQSAQMLCPMILVLELPAQATMVATAALRTFDVWGGDIIDATHATHSIHLNLIQIN